MCPLDIENVTLIGKKKKKKEKHKPPKKGKEKEWHWDFLPYKTTRSHATGQGKEKHLDFLIKQNKNQ